MFLTQQLKCSKLESWDTVQIATRITHAKAVVHSRHQNARQYALLKIFES